VKILFCGTQVPDEIEYQVKHISAAGNRFQNNLISNLKACGHSVTECAYIGVPISQEIQEKLDDTTVLKSSGFLKSIIQYRGQVQGLLDDSDAVICYNVIYAWMGLPFWARRKKKKSIAIIADYSEAISYKNLAGKMYAFLQGMCMRHFDTVVGLSSNIEKKLSKKQRFVLMEGGIDRKLYDGFCYKDTANIETKVFLYSGLLSTVTGVDKLLEMMGKIKNPNVNLWISGKGDLETEVMAAAKADSRIKNLGHLPYEDYVKTLGEADALLNPRNMELPENQNNFPSKIMDYLASGKTIISTKFVGWERFKDNIIFCDTYDEMEKMLEISTFEELEMTYDRNRSFASKFLWEEQIKKILR